MSRVLWWQNSLSQLVRLKKQGSRWQIAELFNSGSAKNPNMQPLDPCDRHPNGNIKYMLLEMEGQAFYLHVNISSDGRTISFP